MNKIIPIITFLGVLLLFSSQVQAVMFANDYITLYKDEEPLSDKSIIIMTFDEYTNKSFFTELYDGGEFIRNQQDSLILTFLTIMKIMLIITYPPRLKILHIILRSLYQHLKIIIHMVVSLVELLVVTDTLI
jgi:hypothetical protein